MKPQRFAATTLAALFTLAACAENPVAPASTVMDAAISPSFSRAANHPYTFTRLDVPGAAQTQPFGINARDRVVGSYVQGGVTRGFIYEAGVWTTNIVYPGAVFTQLRGVGPGGEIVGIYRNAGETPGIGFHGFLLTTEGVFIAVNFPGHVNNVTNRIMPDGTLLGCYHDADIMDSMHGATYSREVYAPTPATGPGEGYSSLDNMASMINGGAPGGRKLTGQIFDQHQRAFVIDGGVLTEFDAPGSSATIAWDMNPAGTVVGLFVAAGRTHGFVLDHWRVVGGEVTGEYTTINYPNSAYTDVFGINASGDIVGKFRETPTGPFHGYIATRKAE